MRKSTAFTRVICLLLVSCASAADDNPVVLAEFCDGVAVVGEGVDLDAAPDQLAQTAREFSAHFGRLATNGAAASISSHLNLIGETYRSIAEQVASGVATDDVLRGIGGRFTAALTAVDEFVTDKC